MLHTLPERFSSNTTSIKGHDSRPLQTLHSFQGRSKLRSTAKAFVTPSRMTPSSPMRAHLALHLGSCPEHGRCIPFFRLWDLLETIGRSVSFNPRLQSPFLLTPSSTSPSFCHRWSLLTPYFPCASLPAAHLPSPSIGGLLEVSDPSTYPSALHIKAPLSML